MTRRAGEKRLRTGAIRWCGLLALVLGLAAATPAHAESTAGVAFSPDPAEDKPVTVTVSGSADAARRLFVLWTTAASCAPTFTGNGAGAQLGDYYGDYLPGGDYSRTFTTTPSEPGTYRVCAYVAQSRDGTPDATATRSTPVRTIRATARIAFGSDPTEDEPVTVSVSGNTETARRLFVLWTTAADCAPTFAGNAAGAQLGDHYGEYLPAGEYTRTFTTIPSEPGTYRVCAYVAQARDGTPDATATAVTTVRTITATTIIAFSPDPTEDEPVTVSVSGNTETARRLFVLWTTAADCAPTFTGNGAGVQLGDHYGEYLPPGEYTRTFTTIPAEPGTYRVCAYVAQAREGTPDSAATAVTSVRAIAASAAVAFGPDPTEERPLSVIVSGATEAARRLFVLWTTAAGCAPTFAGNGAGAQLGDHYGEYLPAGEYSRTFTTIPSEPGAYRACAYVAEARDDAPDATGGGATGVRRLHAEVRIDVDRAPYLIGEARPYRVRGSSEGAYSVHSTVVAGSACPGPPAGAARDAAAAGAFDETASAELGAGDVHTICAWVLHGGTAYASTAVALTKKPLPVPLVASGNPAGTIRDRRPTFSWEGVPEAADTLSLREADGRLVFSVDRAGAFVVDEEDPDTTDVTDPDDYYEDEEDEDEEEAPRAPKRRRVASATWSSTGARTVVSVREQLPPGRYRWSVTRARSDGETVASAPTDIRILGPSVSTLKLRRTSHRGRSSRRPGYTSLRVTATPWTRVRLALRRAGRERLLSFRWGEKRSDTIRLDWSCKVGGGRYRYILTATDDDGRTLTRKGSFATVTRARCRSLRRAERAARRRRAAARLRRERAAERRRQAAERRALRAKIENCHTLNGVVRSYNLDDGSTIPVCVTPYGVVPLWSL